MLEGDERVDLGGKEYFEEVYKANMKKVYTKLYLLTKNQETAKDLTQEVFKKLFLNIERLQYHPNIIGWLYLTATYQILNYYRSSRLKMEVSMPEDIETLFVKEEILDDNLERFKQILTIDELDLIKLKNLYGYSIKDISCKYGLSEAACKMRLHRVYEKIRKKYF